ncbi:hypothetical protein MAM1_0091d04896 [Mucor ambiguus]|uniref:NADP-dependent oxidoreductase domain-containing protein n=1 Tax=Mucor ambiguus TaxID=91626 RepID=A0A0C9LUQ3_9FUNG|nr:hypothetical protein MAM1_0091d04896 [Mucor ambiguus]
MVYTCFPSLSRLHIFDIKKPLGPWVKEKVEEAIWEIHKAAALEFNFFDMTDAYSNGASEKILGKAIKGMNTSCIVIAIEVSNPVFDDVSHFGSTGINENPAMTNYLGLY